jgi:hypothetical protein
MAEAAEDNVNYASPFVGGDEIDDEDLGNVIESEQTTYRSGEPAPIRKANFTPADGSELTISKPEPAAEEPQAAAEEPVAEEPEVAAEEPEAPEPKAIMVPKTRLDQVSAKWREAEARVERLQRQLDSAQPFTAAPEVRLDIGDRAKTMFDQAIDGNLDGANQAFSEIINQVAQQVVNVVREDTARQVVQGGFAMSQEATFDQVVNELESQYAAFRPNTPDYNADLVQETLAISAGFQNAGMTPAEALQRAANYTVTLFGLAQPEAEPPPAAAPQPVKRGGVERGAKAAAAQPPDLPRTAQREREAGDIPDINSLSDEELDALPEAVQRRLRGDFL